ncbi:hypothetical protein AB0M28_26135 [Streptomyces sp. NPDC051940]|uniref:hypothetical protein n=1 Tax=Streptomyces sp. NPDC051940 TaxID=3155675 RepID=UPI00343EAA64
MRRRLLHAAAAVAAVTAPALLLASAPALADTLAAPADTAGMQTYAELEQAAADAAQAYEEAVASQKALLDELKALEEDTHPLKAAVLSAQQAVLDAAEEKATADKAVEDARTRLEEAADDAAKAEAQKALDEAEAAAATAAGKKDAADAALEAAQEALTEARIKTARDYELGKKPEEAARQAKEQTAAALAERRECARLTGLTTLAEGLPSRINAGTTTDFTVHIVNGTARTLTVDPLFLITLRATAERDHMKVQWSYGSGWTELDRGNRLETISPVKPGDRRDVKIRLTVDDEATTGAEGIALLAADASDAYNPCLLGPMKSYAFKVAAAGTDTGGVDDAEPGDVPDEDRPRPGDEQPDTSTQGDRETPVDTEGDLAETGASSALRPLALTSLAAAALGTGAVIAVRRRRTSAN